MKVHQNKLFSVHFQEMPGFKGKRKRGLILTLYKKPFRYRLPVILQKAITKTSKSPHAFAICFIRTDLLKQENEKIDSL
jgi:hypothetical protein